MPSLSVRQWLTAVGGAIIAYAVFVYHTGSDPMWWWSRKPQYNKWSNPNSGSAVLGIYIDQEGQVAISQAVGKLETRVVLKGGLLKLPDDGGITLGPFNGTKPNAVRFWDQLDDGKTAQAVFGGLAKALDDQKVRESRFIGFVTPTSTTLSYSQKLHLQKIALSTGLAETVVFPELHVSALHALDIPSHRTGPVSKVAIVTPDGTHITASAGNLGNAKLHKTPFSLAEFLRNDADPPSNFNQLIFVHSDEDSQDHEQGWTSPSKERVDPRTPLIRHNTFQSVASGAASFVGREVDIMAFNTYVRISTTVSVVLRLSDEDVLSSHILMNEDDKEGLVVFGRDRLPKNSSRLRFSVAHGMDASELLGTINFDLDEVPPGSEPHLVVTGSASWQQHDGVLLTIQVVDLTTGIREFETYTLT